MDNNELTDKDVKTPVFSAGELKKQVTEMSASRLSYSTNVGQLREPKRAFGAELAYCPQIGAKIEILAVETTQFPTRRAESLDWGIQPGLHKNRWRLSGV